VLDSYKIENGFYEAQEYDLGSVFKGQNRLNLTEIVQVVKDWEISPNPFLLLGMSFDIFLLK
jgi:hypothetical protein